MQKEVTDSLRTSFERGLVAATDVVTIRARVLTVTCHPLGGGTLRWGVRGPPSCSSSAQGQRSRQDKSHLPAHRMLHSLPLPPEERVQHLHAAFTCTSTALHGNVCKTHKSQEQRELEQQQKSSSRGQNVPAKPTQGWESGHGKPSRWSLCLLLLPKAPPQGLCSRPSGWFQHPYNPESTLPFDFDQRKHTEPPRKCTFLPSTQPGLAGCEEMRFHPKPRASHVLSYFLFTRSLWNYSVLTAGAPVVLVSSQGFSFFLGEASIFLLF